MSETSHSFRRAIICNVEPRCDLGLVLGDQAPTRTSIVDQVGTPASLSTHSGGTLIENVRAGSSFSSSAENVSS